jgi:hypothetical protein
MMRTLQRSSFIPWPPSPSGCHPRESGGPETSPQAPRKSIVQRLVKVSPVRIESLDQLELPPSLPFLQLLFPRDRAPDVAVMLVPDGRLDAVFRGELRADPIAMLKRARVPDGSLRPHERRSVAPARHDGDAVASLGHPTPLPISPPGKARESVAGIVMCRNQAASRSIARGCSLDPRFRGGDTGGTG